MTVHHSKVRIYDLAKELKQESKRILEDVRREGVDVSVASNTISKELAEKIRNKYFPKKEVSAPRAVRVVKKAARPVEDEAAPPTSRTRRRGAAPPPAEAPVPEVYAEPEREAPPVAAEDAPAARPAAGGVTARLVKKLAPAARAEHPAQAEQQNATATAPAPSEPSVEDYDGDPAQSPMTSEATALAPEAEHAPPHVAATAPPTQTDEAPRPAAATPAPATVPPPGRQIRALKLTDAALRAGLQPGQRVPAPVAPPPPVPGTRERDRGGRGGRGRGGDAPRRIERGAARHARRDGDAADHLHPARRRAPPRRSRRSRRSHGPPRCGGRR